MAIGGYSWNEEEYLDSGYDMGKGAAWFSVRVVLDGGYVVQYNSADRTIIVPPEVIEQKIALMKVAPVGAKVDGVGWRRTEDLFYLRIYENDLPLGEWK
jgi:hypothetical protein